MAETHIDNTSARFAGKIDGKPLRYRIAYCFHPTILIHFIALVVAIYANYKFITHPELLSTPLIYAFIVAIVGQILSVALIKMTSGDKIAAVLREIFCKE